MEDPKDISIFYFKFSETVGELPAEGFTAFPAFLEAVVEEEKNRTWQDVTTAFYSGGPSPDDAGRRGGSRSVLTLADRAVDGNFGGFRSPMRDCPDCVFNLGSTVPVKFIIRDEDGNPITTAEPRISVQRIDGNTLVVPFSNPNLDNIARIDPDGTQYIYNLQLLPETETEVGFVSGEQYRLIVIDKDNLAPKAVVFTVED